MKVPKSNHTITIQGESHRSTTFRTNHKPLTAREREVLRLVAEGHKNKEIAQLLGTSVKTVETQRANIYNKLAFRNIVDLILYAIQNRILSVEISGNSNPRDISIGEMTRTARRRYDNGKSQERNR